MTLAGDAPFEVTVYDKAFEHQGWAGAPSGLVVTPRHNQQPTAALTLAAGDPRVPLLRAKGARAVVRYLDEHCVGGPAYLVSSSGSGDDRSFTFQIADDWTLLSEVLLYQVPTAGLGGQSAAEYHVVTGPAEYVAKTLLQAAIDRADLPYPVTVAPNLGRGADITVKARMSLPTDVLVPLCDQAGIGITVRQTGSGLVVDVYEPQTWPIALSEDGGTLTSSDWTQRAPLVTSVVVAIGGEGTERQYFGPFIDAAAEAAWGRRIERHIDARDIATDDVDKADQAAARAQEALAAGAATAGLSVKLAETAVFRYGGTDGVHVGDRLPVELDAGAEPITDVLREATLSWTEGGVDVTPVIGERRDDPDLTLLRAVDQIGRTQRIQQTRS